MFWMQNSDVAIFEWCQVKFYLYGANSQQKLSHVE